MELDESMRVCVHARVRVCGCVCMRACAYVCVYVYVCLCDLTAVKDKTEVLMCSVHIFNCNVQHCKSYMCAFY